MLPNKNRLSLMIKRLRKSQKEIADEWIMFGGDTPTSDDSVNNTNIDDAATPPEPSGVPLFSSLQMGCGMFKGGELSAVKGLENGYISLPKSLFPTRDGDLVSKMLGHTDIKTTQIYAKVLQQSVDEGFDKLV